MHKIYLLLRDNKQSGPFSLEELLELSPRPFDLIWVEGKSAGWKYPGEIEALKPFLPETINTQKNAGKPVTTTGQFASANTIATKQADNEPASPESAKHIYISFPAHAQFISNAASGSIHEESPEEKLEKKAEEIRKRAQAFLDNKKEQTEDKELDTKYSRSLKDMKEEYATWIYQQTKKKKDLAKYNSVFLFVFIALIIAASGYFLGRKLMSVPPVTTIEPIIIKAGIPQKLATSQNESVSDKVADGNNRDWENNTSNTSTVILPPPDKSLLNSKLISEKEKEKVKANTTANKTSNLTNVLQKDTTTSVLKGVETRVVTESIATKPPQQGSLPETVSIPAKSKKASVPLAKLITISENYEAAKWEQGIKKLQLTVHNNSDESINMVAVDVYYYKENENLLGKRTVYYNNIAPQSSLSIFVPGLKRASYIKYNLGLISSREGLFYNRQ
jgi:hypothetical protein